MNKKEYNKKWNEENPERCRDHNRRYREANRDLLNKKARTYREANLEKCREASRVWDEANPEKKRENRQRQYEKNREQAKEYAKKWLKANPAKRKEQRQKEVCKRRKDPKVRLNRAVSGGIWRCLKDGGGKGGRHWEDLVGWTSQQLRNRLVQLFQHGMTWDNYGEWHVDHVVPISAFNFTKPEHIDFKKCWAIENLQPAWAKDNLQKWNHLDKPFQPSLAMRNVTWKNSKST